MKFTLYKYPNEGDLTHTYSPLMNLVDKDYKIGGFTVENFKMGDLEHPVNIECQPSYDGTVNLILNDDLNPPKIINTRFTKLEDNKFKIIKRNQAQQTNLYKVDNIDEHTRLIKSSELIPIIDLDSVANLGSLKGGMYTFYIKLADEDGNKTDILSESGQVMVVKGNIRNISSISGTILNEVTDKNINLRISNLDKAYSNLYIYYCREYCDENGVRLTEIKQISDPFKINSSTETINITGYEPILDITSDDLNINYNVVTAVKTQAQVQNMLFFGNVQQKNINISELQNLSYYIQVTLKQSKESIGYVDCNYSNSKEDISQVEYYNPNNVYYKLGYWPDEMYRLGIVYILNDNTLSPVFNLRGCEFKNIDDSNYNGEIPEEIPVLERNVFLNDYLSNTFGVFKLPAETETTQIISHNSVKPWYFNMNIPDKISIELKKLDVKGYFFVRQKRLATTLCQGFSLGIDRSGYVPILYHDNKYYAEGFLSNSKKPKLTADLKSREISTNNIFGTCLLNVECSSIPELKSKFDSSAFVITPKKEYTCTRSAKNERHFITNYKNFSLDKGASLETTYIPEDTAQKYIKGYIYSTKCGSAEDVSQFGFIGEKDWSRNAHNLIRGQWCAYLGVNGNLTPNTIYEIKIPGYENGKLKSYFEIRKNDNSPFYAISNRYELKTNNIDVYRGDCYSATVTIRLNRNFSDPEFPITDTIINDLTWYDNYKGYSNMVNGWNASTKGSKKPESIGDYTGMNRADINAVPLGVWITFKYLSNYNIGIRCVDHSHPDEEALLGNPRSFYPNSGFNINSSGKLSDSFIYNQGLNVTLGKKENFIAPNVPYLKELFDNRIMFSDVQTFGNFENAFRIFKSLDYQDIDRQYGAIIKLEPWNNNLLCVFEHGIGIVAVNDQALLSTQSGQSIHMYGAGVLQNKITVISPDFGTIWQDSIIRTPKGIYGVDTTAKKIWRVTYNNQIETISDMRVQQFLNDHIKLKELDKYPLIALRNVKTHYNNYKGDIMFTFYNESQDESWNLCYNERMDTWITKYSWIPLCSENIDNIFYSLDRKRNITDALIYKNQVDDRCVYSDKYELVFENTTDIITSNLGCRYNSDLTISDTQYTINSILYEEINENKRVIKILDSLDGISITNSTINFNYNKIKTQLNDVPIEFIITITAQLTVGGVNANVTSKIGFNLDYHKIDENYESKFNKYYKNNFYVHGRSGIIDQINYENKTLDDQILPTKWYDIQEPFEFEYVVNDQVGLHKIFDNLVIISNNVQPKELEFEITGDVYNFNKSNIFWNENLADTKSYKDKYIYDSNDQPLRRYLGNDTKKTQILNSNCKIIRDTTLNTYSIRVTQECKNIVEYGRRLGNIQYKEDSWYTTILPILYKENDGSEVTQNSRYKEAKIRDKYCKIRIKYSGKDLVIITALTTLYTQSYA